MEDDRVDAAPVEACGQAEHGRREQMEMGGGQATDRGDHQAKLAGRPPLRARVVELST
jgi:hypothetical protein